MRRPHKRSRRWVRAPPSMMLVDPAKQNSTMTRRHGGAWSTATVSSSRTASPTQRLGDGSIITMEADAGADMTSQGGEDTADLPLEQQADDAAALEGGNLSKRRTSRGLSMVPSGVSQAISSRLGPRGEADPTGGQRAIDGGAADVSWHPLG